MSHEQDAPDNNASQTNQSSATGAAESAAQEVPEESHDDKISALSERIATLTDQFVRERAENDNLRKRQQRELANAYKYATEKLHRDLLPVVDSLTLGLQAAIDSKAPEGKDAPPLERFIEGLKMTLDLFRDTLSRHGVEEIDPLGEKFNPERHEAVTMMPSPDHEPNRVIQVAQKGYLLNGRTIRAAQVIVSKEKKEDIHLTEAAQVMGSEKQ